MTNAKRVVFKDSFSGIQLAKSAGIKVIGVAITHTIEDLKSITDLIVKDFTEVNVEIIRSLIL